LLDPESFKPAIGSDTIKAGTLTLEIHRYRIQCLEKAIYGEQEKYTEDLLLDNMAVVKNFYINIIFKVLL
jgi:hypothetical protein